MLTKFAAGLTFAAASAQARSDPTPSWLSSKGSMMDGSHFQPSSWGSASSYQPSWGGDSQWAQPGFKYTPQPSWEEPSWEEPTWENQEEVSSHQPADSHQHEHQQWQQPAPQQHWQQPAPQQHWQQPAPQQHWQQPAPQQHWQQPAPQPHWQQHQQQPTEQPTQPAHNPWSTSQNHHNPYRPAAPAKPEGWYSPTQQYTAPMIQYVSAATKPRYAVCELQNGTFELAQLPGHPVYARLTWGTIQPGSVIDVTINTKGRLGAECDLTGPEFNPLFETDKYGNPNPYQDPARGRITLPATDDMGSIVLDGTDSFLTQLEGPDSIIGRSLSLYANGLPFDCCTIGRDMGPMIEEPAEETMPDNHQHQHQHQHQHYYPQQHQHYYPQQHQYQYPQQQPQQHQ